MKLIPGSREQRGTNFVRALRGLTPFCRPLKHAGAYLLLTAEVDELGHDRLHLAAQVGFTRAGHNVVLLAPGALRPLVSTPPAPTPAPTKPRTWVSRRLARLPPPAQCL